MDGTYDNISWQNFLYFYKDLDPKVKSKNQYVFELQK